jgi:hypothetical protein
MDAASRTTSIMYVPSAPETSNVPMAPIGDSRLFCFFLQGGGVAVHYGGTVAISSCTISGNSASPVCVLMFKSSHGPDGKSALLTCPFRFSSFMMGVASIYQFGVRAICA